MTDIRDVLHDEVEMMVPLAIDFYQSPVLPGNLDPETFCANWTAWLSGGMGVVKGAWVDAHFAGAIGGIFGNSASTGELELSEMFFFLDTRFRGMHLGSELMDAFEDAGRESGAVRVNMVRLWDQHGERMDAIYEGRGYRPVEVVHTKEL